MFLKAYVKDSLLRDVIWSYNYKSRTAHQLKRVSSPSHRRQKSHFANRRHSRVRGGSQPATLSLQTTGIPPAAQPLTLPPTPAPGRVSSLLAPRPILIAESATVNKPNLKLLSKSPRTTFLERRGLGESCTWTFFAVLPSLNNKLSHR